MTQDFSLWKFTVRRAIRGLCTFDAGHGPAPTPNAGFQAVLGALYGEAQFAEFLSYQAWRQAGVGEAAGQTLEMLQQELDAYDEPDTDVATMADPAWWAIMGLAIQVVDLLA